MSFKYYDVNAITNIANTIRQKENTVNLMRIEDMPNHILNIQTGIEPSGSQTINTNGTYNVYNIAEAVVNVAGIEPSGSQTFTENGVYNVYNIAEANIRVPLNSNIYRISNYSGLNNINPNKDDVAIIYTKSNADYTHVDGFDLSREFSLLKSDIESSGGRGYYMFNYEYGDVRLSLELGVEHWGEEWVDNTYIECYGQYQGDQNIDINFRYACNSEDDEYAYFQLETSLTFDTTLNQDLPVPVSLDTEYVSDFTLISSLLTALGAYKYELSNGYQYYVYNSGSDGRTEYNGWINLRFGTDSDPDKILEGSKFLSDIGLVEGTFGTVPTTTVAFVDNFLLNIQNASFVASMDTIKGYRSRVDIQSAPLISQMNTDLVTDASNAFQFCSNLLSIPNFNTSSVVNMARICERCTSITSAPNWNTSNVTDMSYAFAYCYNLTSLPNYDTSNVTNMDSVVPGTKDLVIPNWNTSKVTSMNSAFYATSNLILPNWDTSNVINAGSMFAQTNNLVFQNYNFSNLSYAREMFQYCNNATLPSSLDFSNVKNAYNMFFWSNNLTLGNYDFASVENAFGMFARLNTRTTTIDMFNNAHNITEVRYMFSETNSITTVGNVDTSKCSNFNRMFYFCNNIVNIPVFDMSNLSNLDYTLANMFYNCNRLSNASITNLAKSLLTIPDSVMQNATANQKKISYSAYYRSSTFPGNVSWRFNTSTIGSSLYSQLQQKGFTFINV